MRDISRVESAFFLTCTGLAYEGSGAYRLRLLINEIFSSIYNISGFLSSDLLQWKI